MPLIFKTPKATTTLAAAKPRALSQHLRRFAGWLTETRSAPQVKPGAYALLVEHRDDRV